eukprot:1630049-Pyramimonas_sp.AAC.1
MVWVPAEVYNSEAKKNHKPSFEKLSRPDMESEFLSPPGRKSSGTEHRAAAGWKARASSSAEPLPSCTGSRTHAYAS